jgi:MFS family permease
MAIPPSSSPGPKAIAPRAGLALALLLSINLFNYIDRQILSAVLPKIELDAAIFSPHDPNLKFKLGSLATAFLISYMLAAPLFGRWGDKWSRWLLVGVGVIVWSLASGASGLAIGFVMLFLTRCFVGIGEAAYGPVAPSMLSDMYPVEHRGRILAWFYMAIPVGSALGFVLGGIVADTSWGWRGAFLVVVLPGLLLGVLCFLMKEPPRPQAVLAEKLHWPGILRELRNIRSFVLCSLGMTCTTFVLGGVAVWVPYYIFEQEARFQITPTHLEKLAEQKASDGTPVIAPEVIAKLQPMAGEARFSWLELKDKIAHSTLTPDEISLYQQRIVEGLAAPDSMTLSSINFTFGAILVASGLIATLIGGWLGDYFRRKVRGSYFLVSGLGALVAFPCFVAMLYVPFPYAWIFVALAIFFLFINTGPANTILANVTRPAIRSSAFAVNILVIHMLGDAISPSLIGLIADQANLRLAFVIVSFFILVAAVLWTYGARYLDEETRVISEMETLPPSTS